MKMLKIPNLCHNLFFKLKEIMKQIKSLLCENEKKKKVNGIWNARFGSVVWNTLIILDFYVDYVFLLFDFMFFC